jgi:MFS-type transporter involved in bile tolerance (Atg22 family)
MNPLNNYRFSSYAVLAMGLINLRYQTGNQGNLSKSSILIIIGFLVLVSTFITKFAPFLQKKLTKKISLVLLIGLIVYGTLI